MKYYCELGANDGILQSRSLDFDKDENFIGVLIEPDLKSYNGLIKNRSEKNHFVNVACASFEEGEHESDFFNNGLMSGLPGSYDWLHSYGRTSKVTVKPLQVILDDLKITELEHLFLDVEGKEVNVLNGIDYNKTTIKNIEVEIHFARDEAIVKTIMSDNGFELQNPTLGDGLKKLNFRRCI